MHKEPKTKIRKIGALLQNATTAYFHYKLGLNQGMNHKVCPFQTTHTQEHLHKEVLSILRLWEYVVVLETKGLLLHVL